MKSRCIFTGMVTLLLLAGCVEPPAIEQPVDDLSEWSYAELNERFVVPVYQSRISWMDWDSASDIDPDRLIAFYVYYMAYESDLQEYYNTLEANSNFDPIAPAADVEAVVLAHFDVSAEYLRQGEAYDSETNTYRLFGLGGLSNCKVIAAALDNNNLSLIYESYQGDRYTGLGQIILALDETTYKYVSSRFCDASNAGRDVDLDNYEEVFEKYIKKAHFSGILGSSWESPEEIDPDKFVDYFTFEQIYSEISWKGITGYPAEAVEVYIQQYFDVSTEHMRSGEMYDPESNVYHSEGVGGAANPKVVAADLDGDELLIRVEVYSAADDTVLIWGYTTTIQLRGDGFSFLRNEEWS